jgi:hypothetical protein
MLEPNNATLTLTCNGQPAMILDITGLLDLRLAARTMGGKLLASASPAVADPTWKLQVSPGADAVLIASCMLATVLMHTGGTEAASPDPYASL